MTDYLKAGILFLGVLGGERIGVAVAHAQGFPAGAVRIVVGYPPGGSADTTARVLANEMARDLAVTVLVDNRPGGGTTIASDAVAKAKPDGHTLLLNWHQSVAKTLLKEKLPYDPERDFVPVSRVATGATILVVHPSVPARTLKELMALARARPGQLNAASGGFGSASHMAAAQFEAVTGIRFTTIQYKGGAPASQSLLVGDTQVMFGASPTLIPLINAGRLRPLVVSLRRGSASIPGIPGSEAAGLPGFESTFWFGLFAPAGTPAPAVRRLHQSVTASLASADVRARFASSGMDATPSASPEAFAAEVAAEGPKLEKLLRELGARIE
jgi:tripartite-type tricarboxylate transporter receptor subunit TctC